MNKLECAQLLTIVSAVDNRTVLPGTVEVWHPIIKHLDLDVAVEAVQLHFAESDKYLLPAHVNACARRVREKRDREARRAAPRAIEPQQITLDRAEFERLTQEAIAANRSSA